MHYAFFINILSETSVKSYYLIHHVSISLHICSHGTKWLLLTGLFWNFILGFLLKSICCIQFLLKSDKNRTLYMKAYVSLWLISLSFLFWINIKQEVVKESTHTNFMSSAFFQSHVIYVIIASNKAKPWTQKKIGYLNILQHHIDAICMPVTWYYFLIKE
jgi:hypothetical protein